MADKPTSKEVRGRMTAAETLRIGVTADGKDIFASAAIASKAAALDKATAAKKKKKTALAAVEGGIDDANKDNKRKK